MDEFGETDAAADFIARERETLGDMEAEIIADNGNGGNAEQMSSGSFEMVEKADDFNDEQGAASEEAFAGMQLHSNVNVSKEVPEKIRLWQENQKQMLEKKDQDEKEAIEKLRHDGKEELDTWYKNHESTLEKTRAMRVQDSEMSDTNGTTESEDWISIYNLIDFSQAKASKSGRDTTRMKNIFLQLKQNPLTRENN